MENHAPEDETIPRTVLEYLHPRFPNDGSNRTTLTTLEVSAGMLCFLLCLSIGYYFVFEN
jgi:hypothetical protein